MAGDLERFLQQAAERLAEKVNQAAGQKPRPRPSRQPVRQAERAGVDPDVLDAEIIDAELVSTSRRELGPDPLSNIDTRPALAQGIDQADERMADRIHDVLDHDIMHLRDASSALAKGGSRSNAASQVERRDRLVSPLIQMLRQPDTLRAAFIAGEIFNRKF